MLILLMTVFANIAILLGIPILREIVLFVFLSFIPGFVILKLFKLTEFNFLETFFFSVALSVISVMFIGLLTDQLCLLLGLSKSLSVLPLMATISAFALIGFLIEYKRDSSDTLNWKVIFEGKLRDISPLLIILILLPFLSAIGVLFNIISITLISCVIIAALCIVGVVSKRFVPENLLPLLIFSISVTVVCQIVLTSKYVLGWDANLEYYVFRMTQLNGHWGFLSANTNRLVTLTFNSMLSISLLPAIYSALMRVQGEIVFKILYPFLLSLIPLVIYQMVKKMFGKLTGFLSALFFVFTPSAFLYGPFGVNRQIVGELFLVLSFFLLINKTIPLTKRRLLLIIFGLGLAVSHYALAYIYLSIVALVFIISKFKPNIGDALNATTLSFLFVGTFSWYAIGSSFPLISLIGNITTTISELTTGTMDNPQAASLSNMIAIPNTFTAASWINLSILGITYLFLIIGVLSVVVGSKEKGMPAIFRLVLIYAAFILTASAIAPTIASILNFERIYGITLLFLSPCFVVGAQKLLAVIRKTWTKMKLHKRRQFYLNGNKMNLAILLIAVILSAYFLSQVGFVNRVTGGAIRSYNVDFDRQIASNDSQIKIGLYKFYIPVQDVFSASWLSNHRVETSKVYCDYLSGTHVLFSYGLIPNKLIYPIFNTTDPSQGSYVYLGSLNIVDKQIATETGSFSASEISSISTYSDHIYSNGNSEIWYIFAS